ncbi:MAG: ATP phosphoribosyltransferase regulatory subunit [Symbiobacteriia bacterium]
MKPNQGRGQLPEGVRDVLYGEAASRRHLEGILLDTYGRWGYHEVATPTLELLDNMLPGLSGQAQDELYKLVDRRGRVLALRPDMTTPIARLAGTHLQQAEPPIRLCYSAPVFRYTGGNSARPHEVRQSGVELLGEPGCQGDAEVIALVAAALRAAGVTTFALSLSHCRILDGILEQCGLSATAAAGLRQALLDRDLVRYEQAVQALGLPAADADLLMLATALGNLEQVGGALAERLQASSAQQALVEVRQVVRRFKELGVRVPVHLDLGLMRGLDYYTGLVFEAYVPGSGLPVGGGGRYDLLLRSFGRDLAATGFALDVDLLLAARERQAGRRQSTEVPFPALQGGIH